MTFAQYLIKFTKEYQAFFEDLLQTGAEVADREYAQGANDEDTATVSVENEGFSGRIVAEGDGISFLEFGAGIETGITGQTPVQAPYAIYPGSWSIDHARHFYNDGYWYYKGERYDTKTPTGAMQDAAVEMRQRVGEIAGRHFK